MMVKWTTLVTDYPINAEGFEITEKAIKTGERQKPYVLEIKGKDGELRFVEIDESPIKDENGKVIAVSGVLRDITERKRVEEALRKNEKKLQENINKITEEKNKTEAIITAMGEGLSIQDLNYKILYQNKHHIELIGNHIGEYCYEAYEHTNEICKVCPLTHTFSDGKIHTSIRRVCLNGEKSFIEITSSPLRNADGNIYAGIELIRDVTERVRIDTALKNGEERYRNLFNEVPLMVYDGDENWNTISVNPMIEKLTGFTAEEFAQRKVNWIDLIHPNDKERIYKEGVKMTNNPVSISQEYRITRKDGEVIWIEDNKSSKFNSSGKFLGIHGIVGNITERKHAELELKKYSENQAIMVREINHRVRNNLSAIISMLYTEEALARTKGTEECLPILHNLVTRIIGLSTAHSMLSEGEWQPLKLTQLCEKVINATVKSLHSSKTVNLLVSPSEVYVDSNQAHHLALVINELTTNSLKYALKEKEKIIINIIAKKEGNNILLQFHDDGPGYPIEMLKGDFSKASTGFDLINRIVKKS